jgi:YHS domain-containing protein
MVNDPVCGMQIDPRKAAAQNVYHGQTYYFCSIDCKGMFDREPEKYAVQARQEQPNDQHHYHK